MSRRVQHRVPSSHQLVSPLPVPMHRLFSGIEKPLAMVVVALVPHLDEIHTLWKKLLKDRLKLGPTAMRALVGVDVETQCNHLRTGNIKSFADALEAHGRLLESRRVPMDRAVAALNLYMEACVPFLSSLSSQFRPDIVVRAIGAIQCFLVVGFSKQGKQEWRDLEQRLIESEQRLRRYSVHLVGVYEQTGRSIARDLHDDIGHNLLVLKLYLELINIDLKNGHPDQVVQKLDEAVNLIGHAIDGVRRLAFNLGPAILEEAGFIPTVRRYADQFTDRTGIKTKFKVQLGLKLPSIFEVTLYRILQGALSNVVEHSGAKNILIALSTKAGKVAAPIVLMTIRDDGKGFDLSKTLRDPSHAFGLLTMRQRVEMLGGTFVLKSRTRRVGSEGRGTTIEVAIPIEDIEAEAE